MSSIAVWEERFSGMEDRKRRKVIDALKVITETEEIMKDYSWTGLGSILIIAEAMQKKAEREEAERVVACALAEQPAGKVRA